MSLEPEEVHAAVFQSSEDREQHVSEKDFSSSEDSLDSLEGSGEEFHPDTEGSCSSEEEDEEEGLAEEEEEKEEKVKEVKKEDSSLWTSRNGEILWSPTNAETLRYIPPPILKSGPTYYTISRVSSPETAFDLFFPTDILESIMQFTNLEGNRSVKDWKDVTEEELRAYLGLLILAGVYRSHHESTTSLWDHETGRAVFAATMSKSRFLQINAVLRFRDRLSRPEHQMRDKMAPIKDLWSRWSTSLQKFYNPGRDVCVDEQLVSFRGRCAFRQYMPSKPAKYGLKIWALCDVQTSYAWRLQVYTGKSDSGPREHNQGMRVVLELTNELNGHTVTTDNFFTSYALAEKLQKRKMALVGTIRLNKAELPPHLLAIKHRPVLSSVFGFTQNKAVVSYIPKKGKNVVLFSSRHREPEVERCGKLKPQIILDYNKCKGAVDHLDQVCGTYSCRRRTLRWPMCLFYHMIDVSCYNAYVLFNCVQHGWDSPKRIMRRIFLEQLGRALIAPAIANRKHLPRGQFAASIVLEAQRKVHEGEEEEMEKPQAPKLRKRCLFCTSRKMVFIQCHECGNHVCKTHVKMICPSCQSGSSAQGKTPKKTHKKTPNKTPDKTHEKTPNKTPDKTHEKTPNKTPGKRDHEERMKKTHKKLKYDEN